MQKNYVNYTFQRNAVFQYFGGIIMEIPMESLYAELYSIMSPLVREITIIEETNIKLRQLAKQVLDEIKKSIGNEEYTKLLSKIQQNLNTKKAERKKARSQQVN